MQRHRLGRREFITLLGGAAAWPLAARAQQALPPVIGHLAQGTPEATGDLVAALRKGLAEAGLVDGKDFTSEFRWAHGDGDRLPGLAVDLARQRVAVMVPLDTVAAARAAKAATTEIPIVFTIGPDPVRAGLVTSLNSPGGNVTGISTMNLDIGAKWVGLIHELLPAARRLAVLVNIGNAEVARSIIAGAQDGALAIGVQTEIVFASAEARSRPRSPTLVPARKRCSSSRTCSSSDSARELRPWRSARSCRRCPRCRTFRRLAG
jgi:putative ABC transport system substrate-binding protein